MRFFPVFLWLLPLWAQTTAPALPYPKFAVTVISAIMGKVQVNESPGQVAPAHPFQNCARSREAVTVTEVPPAKLLPDGWLLTAPLTLTTVRYTQGVATGSIRRFVACSNA